MKTQSYAPDPNATAGPRARAKTSNALSIYLHRQDRDLLQAVADNDNRTLSQMIRILLREALEARGYAIGGLK